MHFSEADATLLIEAAVHRAHAYPPDSKVALRLQCLARSLGDEHGIPVDEWYDGRS